VALFLSWYSSAGTLSEARSYTSASMRVSEVRFFCATDGSLPSDLASYSPFMRSPLVTATPGPPPPPFSGGIPLVSSVVDCKRSGLLPPCSAQRSSTTIPPAVSPSFPIETCRHFCLFGQVLSPLPASRYAKAPFSSPGSCHVSRVRSFFWCLFRFPLRPSDRPPPTTLL